MMGTDEPRFVSRFIVQILAEDYDRSYWITLFSFNNEIRPVAYGPLGLS